MKNSRDAVIDSTVERKANSLGLRSHEISKAKEVTSILWKGQKGIGQAVNEAATLIKEGKV